MNYKENKFDTSSKLILQDFEDDITPYNIPPINKFFASPNIENFVEPETSKFNFTTAVL